MACEKTSVPFRLNVVLFTKVVYTYVPSVVAVLAVHQNGKKNCNESKEERAGRQD